MKTVPDTRQVTVVFKTHLDIGFTDYAHRVVQRYFEDFIPGALRLAKETRDQPNRFVWTTGSWLIYQFLEHASRREKARMEEAILAGDFHWHALPFTTHTELMDESLFSLSLQFRDRLDARFGRKTSAAKMTDVPGHTKAMVPLLARAGVKLLHIGVNPASTVPDVPPVFVWKVGGSELVVIYDKVYGSTNLLPGNTAVSVNLTNDNLGPPSDKEITDIYDSLHRQFPKATIVPGNLTDIADHLWKQRASLPVITAEIGDTWIHGLGTDPQKVASFRSLSRLRQKFIRQKQLTKGGDIDLKFGGSLMLVAEHTWGMDIKTHLADFRIYQPAALGRALKKKNFQEAAASWNEQRLYIDQAVRALPASLKKEATTELSVLRPKKISMSRWKTVKTEDPVVLGDWTLQIDPLNGSIRSLRKNRDTLIPNHSRFHLGVLAYQTFSPAEVKRFYRQYNTLDIEWAQKDFMKVGLPPSAPSGWHQPLVKKTHVHSGESSLLVELAFDRKAQSLGAPREVTLRYDLDGDGLKMELQWFGKQANRMPEALWLGFVPKLLPSSSWTVEKLGLDIDLQDVVSKGARGLHASTGPVRTGNFSVYSPDAVLVAPEKTKLLNFDDRLPAKGRGIQFNLWNNIWNTNFPQWYSHDARFRFELRWKDFTPRGSSLPV